MSKNYIDVSVSTGKPTRVSVSTPANQQNVDVTRDTSAYNADISKQWATSETLVLNEDYSSKYYANKSKGYAQNAENFEAAARETYDNIVTKSDNAITEIEELKEISEQEISIAVADGLTEINNKKNTAISDIEAVGEEEQEIFEILVDAEKQGIKDLIDTGKDELKESIGDIKVLTTLEIGDIGIAPLGIDETQGKRRYLNGQVIIQEQYAQFTNKVKSAVALYPSLACTESEWQTTKTMTVGGQVGKFVIDDEQGTIRLPKIIMPIQGLTDLSKLGEIVEAGLPNITGSVNSVNGGASSAGTGAIVKTTSSRTGQHDGGSENQWMTLKIDASLSNPIYSNSNTVQQEQIQYPYFIQVATGAETEDNIINEIELNNPFSLLDYKYSEYELNNISWLRSNGQYNSKAVYPAVYDLLLKIYNGIETKAGVSVKLTTQSFTDYDFVLNTSNETFRLPIKVKLASGKAVVGNGMVLGLTNGNKNFGLAFPSGGAGLSAYVSNYGVNVSSTQSSQSDTSAGKFGITTDSTKSGIETSDSDLYLYFYVGETVQNANLINAGRIQEKVAECLTRSNKNEINSWVCPDWSNAINYANNTTVNTAPDNGYVVINYNYQGEGGMFKINGTIVGSATGNSSYRCVLNGMYVVNKGDTFQIVKTSASSSSDKYTPLVYKFVPMKGAN